MVALIFQNATDVTLIYEAEHIYIYKNLEQQKLF